MFRPGGIDSFESVSVRERAARKNITACGVNLVAAGIISPPDCLF